jgi:serine/threonine-protein kinase
MIAPTVRATVLALLLAAGASAASAQGAWRAYHNDRFGVSADVPSDWKAGEEPANNDGLVFSSPDGNATITVSGILNLDGLKQAMADEQKAQQGETVTYRNGSARQAVISGTRGEVIFYRKVIVSCNDQILNHLVIEYPAAQRQAYDALVTHVAGSLRSGRSWQIPNCR